MAALEVIRDKLQKYPDVKFDMSDSHVIIFPRTAGGFSVSLYVHDTGYTVGFEGWHEEFVQESEALNFLAFGLSEDCRLRVVSMANWDYRWIVQHRSNGTWVDESEVGNFWFPRWMTRDRYLQNDVIKGT
jgi:hypothetical protein